MKEVSKKNRERPRTIHIDVYCTGSDSKESSSSDSDGGSSSDESNTSSCYTVLRSDQAKVRHIRKKSGLPLSMVQQDPEPEDGSRSSKTSKKPLLSYRISAKELADALERKNSGSSQRLRDQQDDEAFFRDLTLSDSSIQWDATGASETDVESSSSPDGDDSTSKSKTWISPEEQRLRCHMLEQRKQQWRLAKTAEDKHLPKADLGDSSSSLPVQTGDLRAFLLRHSGSDKQHISRQSSRRCPNSSAETVVKPTEKPAGPFLQPPSPFATGGLSSYRPKRPSSIGPICRTPAPPRDLRKTRDSPVDIPWQFRLAGLTTATTATSPGARSPLKKFGRHIGPARNPDCSCAHCVEHFARLRSVGPCKPRF